MNIPASFFFLFWFKNTILSTSTGILLGLLLGFAGLGAIPGAIIGFLFYQFYVGRYFCGKRRGDFEYQYLSRIIENQSRKTIRKYFGFWMYLRYYLDQFNNIGYLQAEVCKKVLKTRHLIDNEEMSFPILLKLAFLCLKEDLLDSETEFLKKALIIKPNDLVANYRMAICSEKRDDAEGAIQYYRHAMNDLHCKSKHLTAFLNKQIDRINTKGTMKRPPALGLRFSSW